MEEKVTLWKRMLCLVQKFQSIIAAKFFPKLHVKCTPWKKLLTSSDCTVQTTPLQVKGHSFPEFCTKSLLYLVSKDDFLPLTIEAVCWKCSCKKFRWVMTSRHCLHVGSQLQSMVHWYLMDNFRVYMKLNTFSTMELRTASMLYSTFNKYITNNNLSRLATLSSYILQFAFSFIFFFLAYPGLPQKVTIEVTFLEVLVTVYF